ncbi:hypothetical protein [Microbacterium sp.]|uniref:hypothetical protein n=1 Tax=Microbacterium sp. TaxID=51671 RepID=UPI0025CF6DFF|nr:hypothetical protein [Microbacterium sp.]
MHWLELPLDDSTRELLRKKFPQPYESILSIPRVERGEAWVRQLDWVHGGPRARAWVEDSTGSVVLVEAVGDDPPGAGYVWAHMWIKGLDVVEQIPMPLRYNNVEYLERWLAEWTKKLGGMLPGWPSPRDEPLKALYPEPDYKSLTPEPLSEESKRRFQRQTELEQQLKRRDWQDFYAGLYPRLGVVGEDGRPMTAKEITEDLLPRVLHLMEVPDEIYWVTDLQARHDQIMWFVAEGKAPTGWLLAEFYFGEIPLSEFMNRYTR